MKLSLIGGCLCRAIRYECSAEPILSYKCHCRDCQRTGGSGFLPLLWVHEDALRLTGADSFTHGSMANALPQAIGAAVRYPGRQVISLSGDGGFTMLMGDFITLVQQGLPVKVVIYDNGSLGMVKLEQNVAGLRDFGTELENPDFAKVAEAMGATGIRVEDPSEVRPAIERALAVDGPVLVDVLTNPSELSLPPKATLAQAQGYSLYLLKEILGGGAGDVYESLDSNLR